MKRKAIIEHADDVSLEQALHAVMRVVAKGRISEARGIKHFCWVTTFGSGLVVNTRDKKTDGSADSFYVYWEVPASSKQD